MVDVANDALRVRTVTVELLRAGPAHNQLLSPLTPYIGICDDGEACVVHLPYVHHAFLRRLALLRYAGDERGERQATLQEFGDDIARVLGGIPRLPGSLTGEKGGPPQLVHLRLVLSASEVAILPFELAKVPITSNTWGQDWLSTQARVPVVLTRRTRHASMGDARWPLRPRILFVAADPLEVPLQEHRAALLEAVRPFMRAQVSAVVSADGRREQIGDLLTILSHARFTDVVTECRSQRYTHVHVLAHGGTDPNAEELSHGLVLQNADGEADVISGERIASAFACVVDGGVHRPTVVTLATCDSGDIGSVLVADASLAHQLHQAGIPLVVASQFPLTKPGSVVMVEELYRGLLWAEHPVKLLNRLRTDLHARFGGTSHDWASIVAYEALPPDLDAQLEEMHYRQSKLAVDVAVDRVEKGAGADSVALLKALSDTTARLPGHGPFALEAIGLRASSAKVLAWVEFQAALRQDDAELAADGLARCHAGLDLALQEYGRAVAGFLLNDQVAVQRVASLHWVLGQQLCLSAVLGRQPPEGAWEAAFLSASAQLVLPEAEQMWAHGSLAELWLLRLVDPALSAEKRTQAEQQALHHTARFVAICRSPEALRSTHRQLMRYVDWWGHERLEQSLIDEGVNHRAPWQSLGIVPVARAMATLLQPRSPRRTAAKTEPRPAAPPVPAAPAAPAAPSGDLLGARKPAAPHPAADATGFIEIEMLPAGHGDCLLVRYGSGTASHHVLIDCGTQASYPTLRARLQQLPDGHRHLELFMLSHIDADHIGGAIPLLADDTLGLSFGDIWFNGWKHISATMGAKQGEIFSEQIERQGLPWNRWRDGNAIVLPGDTLPTCTLPGGLLLTLLSPSRDKLATLATKWKKEITGLGLTPGQGSDFDKFLAKTGTTSTDVPALADARFTPDGAANNGSSIAVLAEYRGKAVIFGADAHAPLLSASIKKLLAERGLKRLPLSAFKVPHHGSQNNLDIGTMQLLDCRNYLLSSNGDYFNHPDRQAVARIIHYGGPRPRLWFNFRSEQNKVWESAALQAQYGYEAVYPEEGHEGIVLRFRQDVNL